MGARKPKKSAGSRSKEVKPDDPVRANMPVPTGVVEVLCVTCGYTNLS
ncbi:MAG: hypothetical protein AAB389_03875 [Patescibacteria group bacterium]